MIQECAFAHLNVRDMGMLRDKFDGQRYFDTLREDIISEFAFEKYINLEKFDWQRREKKSYRRKYYEFNGVTIELVSFNIGTTPKINPSKIDNVVFVCVKPDLRVYISGLANKDLIISRSIPIKPYFPLNPGLQEIKEFTGFILFKNLDELC